MRKLKDSDKLFLKTQEVFIKRKFKCAICGNRITKKTGHLHPLPWHSIIPIYEHPDHFLHLVCNDIHGEYLKQKALNVWENIFKLIIDNKRELDKP